MRHAPAQPEPPDGFGVTTLPATGVTPSGWLPGAAGAEPAGFARLWTTFMSARVLVALAVLGLHMAVHLTARPQPAWLLALCAGYLVLTALVRTMATPSGPGRHFDAQWLYAVGVDVAFFVVLHAQQGAAINFTPLLALPVMMASIMGSRALALGTAALVTLALLGLGITAHGGTSELVQVALTGAGLLVLALVTNQLSTRLAREESAARRNRVEAQMQALVNSMVIEALSDGVLVVDHHYVVRAANPAARLMLGSDQEITPHLFSLDDNVAWTQLTQLATMTFAEGPIDGVDVQLHLDDRPDSHLQVRTQRTPPVGDGGTSLCVMFLQDLREMEAQLRTEKLAAMGRMSAAVAHEIRNPLAAISQANALLEEDLESPAQRRLTAMVRQNVERLRHIVDDVLDVARAQGNGHASEAQSIGLDHLTAAFCEEWAQQHQAGDRLQLDLRAADTVVQFDRDHLRRVLVNLLDNAARYATLLPGAIQVATRAPRHGAPMLQVWSDGAPLEASVRRHLFEPFFSSESRSSGLGLFICRELCERHGATIAHERRVREQDGRTAEGNDFFVSFRRARPPSAQLSPDFTQLP